MFGGTAATKSTLVKRGPKEQSENADAGNPPAKRVKVEGNTSNLDDEIKRNFEKGTVSKVRNAPLSYFAAL
jgi:ATP-dependent DNA helicase 2 subunit 1